MKKIGRSTWGAVLMSQMLPGLDPGPQKLLEDVDRTVYAWRAAQ